MDRDAASHASASGAGDTKPPSIIDRESEWATLTRTVDDPGTRHLHLHGPRGTGKTLLAEHAIETLPEPGIPCYVPCITYDTQYKLLTQLFSTVTDDEISGGYHTSQLQNRLADRLVSRPTVIVLDEVDFLLLNDGSDLLYYLSRIADDSLSVITISANHLDLSTVVDERTYSSLQPHHVGFEPYTEQEITTILTYRAWHALTPISISKTALPTIASQSTNVRFGLHWLAAALTEADEALTDEIITEVQTNAVDRYRNTLLEDFTPHHHTVLDAIDQLTTETATVQSGTVYDRYTELCWEEDHEPLTTRRVSDYLTHLELLGIIQADYHYGGTEGKTRKIHLQQIN